MKALKTPSVSSSRRAVKRRTGVHKATGAVAGTMTGLATRTTGTMEVLTEAVAATAGTGTRLGGATAQIAMRTLSSNGRPVVRALEAAPAGIRSAQTEAATSRPVGVRAA